MTFIVQDRKKNIQPGASDSNSESATDSYRVKQQSTTVKDKPRWWIPFGFPRKKWIPLINRHMGLVYDVTDCYNLGKKWIPFINMCKCLPAY